LVDRHRLPVVAVEQRKSRREDDIFSLLELPLTSFEDSHD